MSSVLCVLQNYGDLTAAGVEVIPADLATADVASLLVRAFMHPTYICIYIHLITLSVYIWPM